MKFSVIFALLIWVGYITAVDEGCWWTGCQPTTWKVRGCNLDMDQRAIENCEGGNKYRCCPKNATTSSNTTDNSKPTPKCSWTGCQLRRCCNSEGMEERLALDCKGGNRLQCCPSNGSNTTNSTTPENGKPKNSINKIDPDTGLSYENLAKYLLSQNPIFNLGERLSCALLDPDKKYLVKFGNYAVPACDLCPSFNQLIYQNLLMHENPVKKLSDIDFSECFGICAQYPTDCVAFSHDSVGQICYQFNSTVDARMSSENGFLTVIMTQPTGTVAEWTYIRNTKLTAHSSNQSLSNTFQACMSTCDADSTCLAVSYHFDSRVCNTSSDLTKSESSVVASYASAFKQTSFRNKSTEEKFQLMNDDLLTAAITEYKTPDAGCAKFSNTSTGAYYKPQCLLNPIKDCVVGQRCKFCYYPERGGNNTDLDICPDSSGPKAKHVLRQIENHLEQCLNLEDCIAVIFGTTYFNPLFITASNVRKVSGSSIVYVLKNFQNHYNLILSSKLERSIVQTDSAGYVQNKANSLSDCVATCTSRPTCNRFAYVDLTHSCTLSSADGMINHTEEGSEQVVGIRELPISFTGIRYTEIPGYTARPEVDGKYILATQTCNSKCYQSCQDACNTTPNCTVVVMAQNGNKIDCRLYSSSDLVMEPEDFSRILYRGNVVNITREFLDALPLFQSSDVFDCFGKSDRQSQQSLDISLPTDNSTTTSENRRKRGFWSAVGNFFTSAAETVVETVKGVVEDVKHTAEAAGKLITGDTEGAAEAIQQVGIVQDGINVVKSIDSLAKGDLDGAKEHFRDISYVQTAEDVLDTGKALIEGDWDKVGELAGEVAVGVVASYVPGVGRSKKGKRGGRNKVDREMQKENHSHNQDKRSSDHDERQRENEHQSNQKKCKVTKRSRRAANKKRPKPEKEKCDEVKEDNTCPELSIANILKDGKRRQCFNIKKGRTCEFECSPGYDEKPDYKVSCIERGDDLQWKTQNSHCELESCVASGFKSYYIVMSTPGGLNGKKMTAYTVMYNKDRKIPTWSVALHDITNAIPRVPRHGSFLKHPCTELRLDQPNPESYKSKGETWDKGHLTPAQVIRWSRKASYSVNLYVNIAPQDPATNRWVWTDVEKNAFCTAQKFQSIVVTGTCADTIERTTLGVHIPSCFWKMICYVRHGKHSVVGFVMDNSWLPKSNLAERERRRANGLTPRSLSYVYDKASIQPLQDPFLTSERKLFIGRSVIHSVQPKLCAAVRNLLPEEEQDWKEMLKEQRDAKKKKGNEKKRTERAVVNDKACCSPDEMKSFLATLTNNDDDDDDNDDNDDDNDDDDDDDDDNDEEIGSTDSLVSASSCGKRIVGYFTSWGKYKFSPRMARRLTHVIFAFLETQANGEVSVGCVDPAHSEDCSKDERLARKRLEQMFRVADNFDHLNVMFAVGGWENSQYFSAIAADRERRVVFIASLIQTIKTYGFDGVDIDWEYPVTGGAHEGVTQDKENYVVLLSELRTALNNLAKLEGRETMYLMSIAGAAGQWTLDPGYDMKGLVEQLDFINVMTYDYFGAWGSKWGAYTGPPAPLYFGMPKGFSGKTNVAWTVKYYACRSKEPHKINMGVPFYARYWENVGDVIDPENPMWRKADASGGEFKGGAYTWRQVQVNLSEGVFGNVEFNERTKSKYAYNPAKRLYLGLEDPDTLRYKVDFAVESNLGGLMIWALDQDDEDLSMLETVYDANLCANTDASDIRFKCLPTDEQLWWTPENSDEDLQGKCGDFAPLIGGRFPACDPDDPGYSCCSESGFCGSGPDFCDCTGCVDHGKNPEKLFDYARIPTAEELRFRETCIQNWENGCEKDDVCCSRNCFKGEMNDWKAGTCKPGKKVT